MLVPAFDHQDEIFSAAFSVLQEAIADRSFPAASIAVTHKGQLVALRAFGHFTYGESKAGKSEAIESATDEDRTGAPSFPRSVREDGDSDFLVTTATIFDLASVTKVIATTTAAMILYERGLLELDAPVAGAIPEFLADSCSEPDPRRRDVTFRMLLAHSSGLPAYEKLFLKTHVPEELLRAAFTISLAADPGTRAEYSDIGFIILGAALERITGEPLDIFYQREIFGPLAMASSNFNPPPELRPQIPPTQDDHTSRHRIIQGEVHDENAFVIGGVAGHAGLFSTAEDLARFAHAMLSGGDPIFRPETVALFTRRELTPTGTSRALGWDTPSSPSQSGKYFSSKSFGHLGYTGTSLWIDPNRQLSITLLTNRTWPDNSNQSIKQVRPKFHDAIIEALDKAQ